MPHRGTAAIASAEWTEPLPLIPKPPGNELAQDGDPSDGAGVRMGKQEIASTKADLRKNASHVLDTRRNAVKSGVPIDRSKASRCRATVA